MNEPQITVVGNVAGPPRFRTTPAGIPVADFRVAATPRRKDRATEAWGDGETIWFGVTAWRTLADHCAASLKKGDRVVVTGRLTTRSWEVEGGERRSGLDLAKGVATYQRAPRLTPDQDPWVSSGLVDPDTGEVRPEVPLEHLVEQPDDDLVPVAA